MPVISTLLRRANLENQSLIDPVQKFRVSNPESLIDTDFEYGLQTTKWESIELVNNIPTFFSRTSGDETIAVTDVTATSNSFNIKVTCTSVHNFVIGSPFIITGLKSVTAEGSFVVNTVSSSNVFIYKAKERQKITQSIFDNYTTYLYPGSVYQSTQYTIENFESMETNGSNPSKIVAKTNYPSGFLNGTYFMLANSIGRKEVAFDASLIDVRNTFSTYFDLDTSCNVAGTIGYKSKNIVPYDYQSLKTNFFESCNVNIATNSINIPSHRLTTGTHVMYVTPIGDTPVGGLSNYELYEVNVVDPNNIQLKEVSANRYPGLTRSIMDGYWPDDNGSVNVITTGNYYCIGWDYGHQNFANVDYLGAWGRTTVFTGYFTPPESGNWEFRIGAQDGARLWLGANTYTPTNVNWLCSKIGDTGGFSYTSTATVPLTAYQDYQLVAVYGKVVAQANNDLGFSLEWRKSGSATWLNQAIVLGHKYLTCDQLLYYKNYSFYWNGSIAAFATNIPNGRHFTGTLNRNHLIGVNNSSVITGGFVPDVSGTWRFRIESADASAVWIGDDALEKYRTMSSSGLGKYLMYKSQSTDIDWVANPTNTSIYIEADVTLVANVYYPLCIIYGQQGTNVAYSCAVAFLARRPGDGNTVWRRGIHPYIRTKTANWGYTTSTSVVDITSQGTATYGHHALLKAYLVYDSLTDGRVNTSMNLTNYIDASPIINSPVVFFSLERGFKTHGVQNLFPSYNNYSLSDYNRYVLTATPTVGASTTYVQISNNSRDTVVMGKTWFVPLQNIDEYDGIYRQGHAYSTGTQVTISLQSGNLPVGITNNTTYSVEAINQNYFRLKTYPGLAAVDIKSVPANSIIRFTQNIVNPLANTIFSDGHDFTDGTEVVYDNKGNTSIAGLTNGSTYYVQNANQSTFTISTSVGGASVDFTTVGSGTHSLVSVDRATDGNYRIITAPTANDPYTFELSTNFKIPFNTISFNPRQCLNLNTNLFRYPPNLTQQHRLRTGSRIIYESGGNTEIGGLSNETSYYVIAYNLTLFGLASSYSNATVGQHITTTSYGSGTNHVFHVVSVMGEIGELGSVSMSTASNMIFANTASLDFLGTLRLGDTVKVEIPEVTTSRTISSVNDTNDTITFSTSHNLTTGDTLYYTTTGAEIPGLSNNYIYYVSTPSGNVVVLYDNPTDALAIQNPVNITGTTFAGSSFYTSQRATMFVSKVTDINSKSAITVDTVPPVNTNTGSFVRSTALYPRSDGYFLHRPFDGGVEITPSLNPGTSIIRQTRRYFRYQSGKGIQMAEAVIFAGSYEILSLTRNGDIATSITRKSHRLTPGIVVTVTGITQNDPTTDYWNGTYVVQSTPSQEEFTFDLTQLYDTTLSSNITTDQKIDPLETTAGGYPQYTVKNWSGSSVMVGLYDDQNGIYFEYDGSKLYACLRNSVTQLPGSVTVTFNSSLIIGEYTKFNSQLKAGDTIVIRGMSYRVVYIEPNSDTRMYIQPPYRGISGTGVMVSKTIEFKYEQSQWSVDKCDGTGPTGYVLDVSRIQMVFIDYAWYGAGMIRYGFRMKDGRIAYVHEIINNNYRYESYMRSGNLPGRYEVKTYENPSYVPALMHWGTAVMMDGRFDDDKAYLFTAAGAAIQYQGAITAPTWDMRSDNSYYGVAVYDRFGRYQYTNYYPSTYSVYDPAQGRTITAYRYFIRIADQPGADNNARATLMNTVLNTLKSGATLTGGSGYVRSGTVVVGNLQVSQTISGTAGTGEIILYADQPMNTTIPQVNAVTNFYNIEMVSVTVQLAVSSDFPPSLIPLVSIRLAPSVDNGRPGALGSREIINRMQLTLSSVGILATHDTEIKLLLNAYPYKKNWERVTPPSLSQLLLHSKGDTISGGTQFFTFRVSGGSTDSAGKRITTSVTQDLDELATLGNSVIGGDSIYPNGPDLLTIAATILDTSGISATAPASITGRITWKESQA